MDISGLVQVVLLCQMDILLPDFFSKAVVGRYENKNYLSASDKPKDRKKMVSS
jgi:hypothetical protein